MRFRTFVLGPLAVILGCSAAAEPDAHPAGWAQIDEKTFHFFIPSDVQPFNGGGLAADSYVREFQGKTLHVMFDYGQYSDNLRDHAGTEQLIGGRRSRIVRYEVAAKDSREPRIYVTAVHFYPIDRRSSVGLTMEARSPDVRDYQTAELIFRSIRFR